MSQSPTPTDPSSAATPPRLEMRHIAKSFGGVRALEDVTLTAGAGEVHAICGENGAGKSTLMKILAGAITEFDGEIHFAVHATEVVKTGLSRWPRWCRVPGPSRH